MYLSRITYVWQKKYVLSVDIFFVFALSKIGFKAASHFGGLILNGPIFIMVY